MGRGEEALTLIRPVAEARPDSQQAAFTTGLAALAAADVSVGKGLTHTEYFPARAPITSSPRSSSTSSTGSPLASRRGWCTASSTLIRKSSIKERS